MVRSHCIFITTTIGKKKDYLYSFTITKYLSGIIIFTLSFKVMLWFFLFFFFSLFNTAHYQWGDFSVKFEVYYHVMSNCFWIMARTRNGMAVYNMRPSMEKQPIRKLDQQEGITNYLLSHVYILDHQYCYLLQLMAIMS